MNRFAFLLHLILIAAVARADDITLTDGTVYKNAKAVSHDSVNVTIIDSDGGATVPIVKMSSEWQKKLGYDPLAAAKQVSREQAAQASRVEAKLLDQTKIAAQGQVLSVMPDGLLVQYAITRDSSSALGWTGVAPGGTIFVECKTDGMVDDQAWSGIIWKIGTYTYTEAAGGSATVTKFTTSASEASKAISQAP